MSSRAAALGDALLQRLFARSSTTEHLAWTSLPRKYNVTPGTSVLQSCGWVTLRIDRDTMLKDQFATQIT